MPANETQQQIRKRRMRWSPMTFGNITNGSVSAGPKKKSHRCLIFLNSRLAMPWIEGVYKLQKRQRVLRTEVKCFVGTAILQNRETQSHQKGMVRSWLAQQPRQGAQDQCAADGGDRASPVTVHPVTGDLKTRHGQESAKQ